MAHDLSSIAPRLMAAVVVAAALASGAIALAAAQGSAAPPVKSAPVAHAPKAVRVPAVQGKAYVFAKGILEDAGFAWQVEGKVRGFAANIVARQVPPAGTLVVDSGAPTLKLYLERNTAYEENGTPEDSSPYTGSPVRIPGAARQSPRFRGSKLPPKTRRAAALLRAVADRRQGRMPAQARKFSGGKQPAPRPPAFIAPGAPKEPLREMPLPERAELLNAWLDANPEYTNAHVTHWLYQHAWIVQGAEFGWWHGAQALEILIRFDDRVQKLWGIGAKSQAVARAALAEVRAKAKAK